MDEYTDDHNAYIAQKLSIRRYRSLIVVFGCGGGVAEEFSGS